MGIKYKVNENFFSKWSPKMAYALGYIYADGHIIDSPYMRGKYLNITSIDKDSIDRMKKWLNSEHKIKGVRSHFIGSKTCYILRIGSHKICNDLYKLGIYPRKSLVVDFPKIPKKYLGDFIRGYFDGDGCIYFERRKTKNGKLKISRIRTIFTCGSKKFLIGMDLSLKNINIENGRIYDSKRSYQSLYNTKDSVQIFKLMYKDTITNSFFMRKFNIFKEYFESRPQRIDLVISRILKLHSGHVVK